MSQFSISSVLADYGVGVLLMLTSAIGGGIAGYFKGKKVSTDYVSRKNKLYQPLIEELSAFSRYELDVTSKLSITMLNEVVDNNYKYSVGESLFEKLILLRELINSYDNINLNNVAYNVLVKLFIRGFEDLYGSVIDGICYSTTRDGDEIEYEVEVQELQLLKTGDFTELTNKLLHNKYDMPSYTIYFTNEDDDIEYEEYVHEEVITFYNTAFYTRINGEELPKRQMKISWKGNPSEYIAYKYNFSEAFNADERTIKKYKLREEIILLSQSIIQDLKDIIKRIVDKYEKEVL